MIDVRYRERHVIADLAGLSVAEVRQQLREVCGFTDKAIAKLNGKKIKASLEAETLLSDGDELSFTEVRSIASLLMVVALPLALALTYVAFAYGFVNNTATLTINSVDSNFASITGNTPTKSVTKVFGSFKGAIGASDLFYIELAADFPGDLVATVSLANVDKLVKCYRVMTLLIEARDSSDNLVDINLDSYKNDKDYTLLTLSNGAVELHLSGSDNYNIKLKSGYYVSHIYSSSWSSGETSPIIYCDISHR